jgi:hypothetical protein
MGLLGAAVWCMQCAAQETPPTNAPPLRQISRDIYELGAVRLDKSAHTIRFPAQVNLREGLMEYVMVNTRGKSYESLLRTDVEPYAIHLAMLLIGAKGAPQTPALLQAPSQPFHINRPPGANPLPVITGDTFTIGLRWKTSAGAGEARAEDCFMNLSAKTNASRGPWIYNGSRVVNTHFIAQTEGSIVALVDDIDALANNPRPGHDDDQIWQIDPKVVPPTNTEVEVTFTLEKEKHP